MVTYAKMYGHDKFVDEFEKFCMLVQSCDHEFLLFSDEQRAKTIKSMTKK
jgi:hypothetical protein